MEKLRTYIFLFLLITPIFNLLAQTSGPSNSTALPPATLSAVSKIIAGDQQISLTGPLDADNSNFKIYHWYKLDASGNKQLTSISTRAYSETPAGSGYYSYQLVTENGNGCTSAISDVFNVFVLPKLVVVIDTQSTSICTGIGSTVLTFSPPATSNYKYDYQWTRNGVNITAANQNTYTVKGETTGGTITFGLKVSYDLDPDVNASAQQNITVSLLAGKPLITAN